MHLFNKMITYSACTKQKFEANKRNLSWSSFTMSSYCSSTVHTPDLCYCGLVPVLKTSWTDNNPGRRFWSCRMYLKNERNGCGYYQWHDPPVGVRSKNIIPGLLRKIELLENEIKAMKTKEQKLTIWLMFVVGVIVFLLGLVLFY